MVRWKRPAAAQLKVTALDSFGQPTVHASPGDTLRLRAETLYYAIEAR